MKKKLKEPRIKTKQNKPSKNKTEIRQNNTVEHQTRRYGMKRTESKAKQKIYTNPKIIKTRKVKTKTKTQPELINDLCENENKQKLE